MLSHLKYAARRLRARPALSIAVIGSLALGISTNVAAFDVIDRLLLRAPPHLRDPEQLFRVRVQLTTLGGQSYASDVVSFPEVAELATEKQDLASFAAYARADVLLESTEGATELVAALVSGGFFALTGVGPSVGSLPAFHDTGEDAPLLVVLSHSFWRNQLDARPDVVGTTLILSGRPFTVAAVLPAGFTGFDVSRVDVWLPVTAMAQELTNPTWRADTRTSFLQVVGRLRTVGEPSEALARLNAAFSVGRTTATWSEPQRQLVASAVWPVDGVGSRRARTSVLLSLMAMLLLGVACLNVIGLLFAAALSHRTEIAVRRALGLTRSAEFAMIMSDSVVLTVLAGIMGSLCMAGLAVVIRGGLLPEIEWTGTILSARNVAITVGASFMATTVSLVVVAVQLREPDLAGALKSNGLGSIGMRSSLRGPIIGVQAAMACVLLVGAGFFLVAYRSVRSVDLGLDAAELLLVTLEPERQASGAAEVRDALFSQLAEHARALSYVQDAAVLTHIPLTSSHATSVDIRGRGSAPSVPTGGPYINALGEHAFSTLGLRVLEGRGFVERDHVRGAERVAVVNASMKALAWHGASPVGSCITFAHDQECRRVVGVVPDVVRETLVEPATMQVFVPLHQHTRMMVNRVLFVATRERPDQVQYALKKDLEGLVGQHGVLTVRTFQDLVDPEARSWRAGATVFSGLAFIALAIAIIGVYSSVSSQLEERLPALGVRLALGARPLHIARFVAGQSLAWAAAGCLCGVVAAIALAPEFASVLVAVSPRDLGAIVPAAVLTVAASVAASVPVLVRALRADPKRLILRLSE